MMWRRRRGGRSLGKEDNMEEEEEREWQGAGGSGEIFFTVAGHIFDVGECLF